jgi:queuine tRNA-ribosyltransferase
VHEHEHKRAPAVFDEDILTEHGKLAIVDDEGVTFTSHIDGSLHRFTPERSIEIQHNLSADIFFAFDECTSPTADYDYQKEAMHRTHRWAERSLHAHRGNLEAGKTQGIFGIVQGGRHLDLRKESAETIGKMNFDGYGIGGSFSKQDLGEALIAQMNILPREKPVHLLGIGDPRDVLEGVAAGVDTFDCVSPTRLGRTGTIYTDHGLIDLTVSKYRNDVSMCEETGLSYAYLHHLFKAGEMLGPIIATHHNLAFLNRFARDVRTSILDGRFEEFRRLFVDNFY